MSAAILILITLSQLMLTPSASILNEIINDLTFLKSELNTFMAQDGNTTEMSASGEFVRPPKVVDTTIIKNKLHELQNNFTKLAEAISNKNQNAEDIKNRISSMEKQIEDLIKLYDDKDREIKSDLLANYDHDKNHELEEIAKLQDEEFLKGIKRRHYKFGAADFITIKNETRAVNLVERAYEEIGDLPPMLEFADHVNNLERKLLIYKTIVNSNTFLHCLGCNFEITCEKLLIIKNSSKITGKAKEIFSNLYDLLDQFGKSADIKFTHCGTPDVKIRWLLGYNHTLCSSQHKFGPLGKPAIHDYSGYCYHTDSIYSDIDPFFRRACRLKMSWHPLKIGFVDRN